MSFLADLERRAAGVHDSVRACLENGTTLRLGGARSWMDAGRPVAADEELRVGEGGIVEYVPGDLTITVQAGTPLTEIARVTEGNRQWLPLEPFGKPGGTVGATIATASAGPLAHAFGTPRDQVIGLGFVTGKGDYVRSGGRVVKNVAGFDLTRLLIGSWGTLGVITDATLRLRARPEIDSTMALVLSDDSVRFRRIMSELGSAALAPYTLELVNPGLARPIGLDGDTLVLARFGGNRAAVAAQRELLARFGEIRDLDGGIWHRLATAEPEGAAAARFSGPLADFVPLWKRLERELQDARPLMHGSPGRGVVRCIVPADHAQSLADACADENVRRVFERLPADVWPAVPGTANDALSLRVRDAFDPARILNPGILGQPHS